MDRMRPLKQRKRTPLLRFTMSYLSLLLVIILLGGSMFLVAINVVAGQTAEANAMVLEQMAVRLGSSLEEANRFSYSINRLALVRQLMQCVRPFTANEVYLIREATQSLTPFEDSSGLLAGYQIYFSNGDFLLEPTTCCLNIDLLYGKSFGYADMAVDEWRASVLDTPGGTHIYPARTSQVGGRSGRMLLYTRALTSLYRQVGKIIYYIDENKLCALFAPLAELSAGHVALLSREGEVLSASSPLPQSLSMADIPRNAGDSGSYTAQSGKERLMVFYHRLSSSGYMLAAIAPYAHIITQASAVLKPMLISAAALVLVGLALTFYSLHTNRRPLKKTMELLAADGGNASLARKGLSQLDQAVHQLVSSHNLLSKRLEEQRTELRAAIVASLESGDTLDDGELDILLSHVGIQPEGDRFRGVYLVLRSDRGVDTNELERGDMQRALVMELLTPYAPRISFLSLRNRSSFILLYAKNEGEAEDLNAFFSALYNACRSVGGLEPRFFVGTECRKLCYLPHSLLAARQMMLGGEKSSFLFVAQPEGTARESYLYTEQHEKKLVSLAYMSKEEELFTLLDDLYAENIRRSLPRFERQLLFFRMVSTLSNVLSADSLPQELTFALHKLTMEEFFALLKEHYAFVCRRNREKHTARAEKLLSGVLEYLNENCTDYSLSLSSTALRFGLTEKYLSSFIHEKAGINFSTYVEQLRIRRANELLAQPGLTMDEIALRVGYCNVKTFRRAYIRAVGIAPSEARRITTAQGATDEPTPGESAPGSISFVSNHEGGSI